MNITLRKLELKDAERMYEWMQNPDICCYMQYDFSGQTLDDCNNFIQKSWEDTKNWHYAVVDEKDVYMGTVSLKNIDCVNRNAEFAIVMHMDAQGTGAAGRALHQIIEKGFFEIQLNKIYLYVRTDNIRAVKFYEKQHLNLEGCFNSICIVEKSSEMSDIMRCCVQNMKYGAKKGAGNRNILEEEYGVGLKDFYEMNTKPMLYDDSAMDVIKNKNRKLSEYENRIERLEEELCKL